MYEVSSAKLWERLPLLELGVRDSFFFFWGLGVGEGVNTWWVRSRDEEVYTYRLIESAKALCSLKPWEFPLLGHIFVGTGMSPSYTRS